MKLYLNAVSPYGRIVQVVIDEVGLKDAVETIIIDPWGDADHMRSISPSGKIPALVLDNGDTYIESSCICDYLIQRTDRQSLLPAASEQSALRLQLLGLARAALDCAFGSVVQQRFAASEPYLTDRWHIAIPLLAASIDPLISKLTPKASRALDLTDITLVVTFEYIRFRLEAIEWSQQAPNLSAYIEALADLPAFCTTRPQ